MKIKKLTLETSDIAQTRRFYEQVIGLQVIEQEGSTITFKVGYSELTFSLVINSKPFYHFAFSIPSNKVDEAHAYIAAKTSILPFTAETTIADFTNWNAHAFYFHDNQKNIVEFITHHDLQNNSDRPFSASSITGICEIGIPVDNVTDACTDFNTKYDIPYFSKGPRLPTFSVMGDEQGLFIVTTIGRGWLPTQQPAERHPTNVLIEINGKNNEFEIK